MGDEEVGGLDTVKEQEQRYLDKAITIIDEQIMEKKKACAQGAHDAVEEELLKKNIQALHALETIRPKPYFGRMVRCKFKLFWSSLSTEWLFI